MFPRGNKSGFLELGIEFVEIVKEVHEVVCGGYCVINYESSSFSVTETSVNRLVNEN